VENLKDQTYGFAVTPKAIGFCVHLKRDCVMLKRISARRRLLFAAMGLVVATMAAYASPGAQSAPAPASAQTEKDTPAAQPHRGNDYRDIAPISTSRGRVDPSSQQGEESAVAVLTLTPTPPDIPTATPTLPPAPSPTPIPAPQVALSDLESQMGEAINRERANAGLLPLAIDERLVFLARERSSDMVARGYFSHTTPDGKMVFDYLDESGMYSPYAGENLARTNAEPGQVVQLAVSAFMDSEPHRRNVLSPNYTYIGIGEVDSADGMRYFTVVFIGTNY
jgi:uncharacterized protein YkwD